MKTILIVDDEKKVRSLYGKMLGRQGYNILKAATTEEAHEIMLNISVDLVVLDIDMGKEDGVHFFQMLGAFFPNIRVIVAGAESAGKQKERIAGAFEFYDKAGCISGLTDKVFDVLYPGHQDARQPNKKKTCL